MVVLRINSNASFDLDKLKRAIITGLEGAKSDVAINGDAANNELTINIGTSTQEIHLDLTLNSVKTDWNMA